jgi:hypothetical protein
VVPKLKLGENEKSPSDADPVKDVMKLLPQESRVIVG